MIINIILPFEFDTFNIQEPEKINILESESRG